MNNNPFIPHEYVQVKNPEWIKNAVLYELNTRQFSQEGTFKSAQKQLPRLKDLGIDIIWLMPVHPIGEINRKGSLGSYYSVQNFLGINPEFGNETDFQELVNAIHQNGMHVILDWVANHSSWDNLLTQTNPEFYKKTSDGDFLSTKWRDYDDIIEFDYSNPGLREYMTNAMKFWVDKYNVDGFRCDVAGFVPVDFWEQARKELDLIKPVFMLAEAEDRDLHRHAFDATYNWTLWNMLHRISTGEYHANHLAEAYLAEHVAVFPKAGIRLNFIDNHDKNSWEGTPQQNFGAALETMTVFTILMDGMPLVYNGQEAGLDRSLQFFERDPIQWQSHENEKLFRSLFGLKDRNEALWNGKWGGEMERIPNSAMNSVLSFIRRKNGFTVTGIFNLSNKDVSVECDFGKYSSEYEELFSEEKIRLAEKHRFSLPPWGYRVFSNG